MAEAQPRVIPGLENVKGYVASPAISPDNTEVAFWDADTLSLKRIAITGGAPVLFAQTELPVGLRWERDGLLFGQVGKGIFKLSPGGGMPQLVAAIGDDEIASSPQSLPGGRGLLYSLRKQNGSWDMGRIVVRTPAGELKTIVNGGADGRYDGAGHLLYAVSGVVMAAAFDLDRLETRGTAVPVITGVLRFLGGNTSGIAQFSLADNGTLVFVRGPVAVSDGINNAVERQGRSTDFQHHVNFQRRRRLSRHTIGGIRPARFVSAAASQRTKPTDDATRRRHAARWTGARHFDRSRARRHQRNHTPRPDRRGAELAPGPDREAGALSRGPLLVANTSRHCVY